MRVKAIKLYQAVYLDGKMITHLNLENVRGSGALNSQNVSMKIVEGMGVQIDSDNDCVIISFNNLASIQLYKETKKAASKGA